uniref:type VI secretion system Vgr family protein n=1 Tax=Chitinivorax sp. B TaxID=2502235 RepID=UPI0010F7215E
MRFDNLLDTLRTLLQNPFDQHARLLQLSLAGPATKLNGSFVVARFDGWEAISEGCEFEIQLLSESAHWELKQLIGAPATLEVLTDNRQSRRVSGQVVRAEQLGSNGGMSLYSIRLKPSLHLLSLRQSSRVFGERSVPDIVECLLREHQAFNPWLQWQLKLRRTYPARAYTVQYRETDFTFIERLLRKEGIYWFIDHAGDEVGAHQLVLCDDNDTLLENRASPVRFHRADATEARNAITHWHGQRALQSGAVSLLSYDYKAAGAATSTLPTHHQYSEGSQALVAGLEHYDVPGNLYGEHQGDLDRYAEQRMEAIEAQAKQFDGRSVVPELQAGQWFSLTDHAIHDQDEPRQRQFLLLRVEHQGRNNFDNVFMHGIHTLFRLPQQDDRPLYENHVTALRRLIPYRPHFDPVQHAAPTAPGPQIAIVVGPPGEEIHTDEWGRIKIQFPWQRGQDHRPADTGSGAGYTDNSSCWVQVEQAISGAGWGARFLPRVGQSVVVDFLDGQIDRPIVRSVVHNANHPAVDFSRVGSLPANKTLYGYKSKEYQADGYSELLFDDSTGQIRTRLATSHGQTELNLGWLAHPRQDGKAKPRGEGAELRTDDSLALRSAKGMLLSAWQRLHASEGQLAREEYLALMQECLDLFKSLGTYAAQHQGLPVESEPQQAVQQGVQHWEDGSNTQPDAPVDKEAAIIGLTAPQGISLATPKTLVSYAGVNLDSIARQHLQLTSGQRVNVNAGQGISLFSHANGIKAIAHQGKFLLQSQHDDTEVNAAKNVRLTATDGKLIG